MGYSIFSDFGDISTWLSFDIYLTQRCISVDFFKIIFTEVSYNLKYNMVHLDPTPSLKYLLDNLC